MAAVQRTSFNDRKGWRGGCSELRRSTVNGVITHEHETNGGYLCPRWETCDREPLQQEQVTNSGARRPLDGHRPGRDRGGRELSPTRPSETRPRVPTRGVEPHLGLAGGVPPTTGKVCMTTTRESSNTADEAAALREAMVRELCEWGDIRSAAVADAARAVPRHLFAPSETLEDAYAANRALVTKRDEQGLATSSLSATHIQVTMLEQAQLEPGMRVLEVGSGGYNASLIAELVGASGTVVSLDIDSDIVERARECLDAAGYERVTVALDDAENGYVDGAPFDRIIVTAGAWDIPPAWIEQLAPGGRIVVPLRMRGLTRSVVLERDGAHLVSAGYRLCGFVPMQGASAREERLLPLEGSEVALRVEEEQLLDVTGMRQALRGQRVERWSGVLFDQVDELDFWIATSARVFGMLAARTEAIERGLVARSAARGVPTLICGASFAYRTKRPIEGTENFETGVIAHGPDADAVADEYVELLRRWDGDLRGGPGARIEVFPAATPTSELPGGRVIEKAHARLVVAWPGARDH